MPINYTIRIDDRAVLVVVRQYDSAGGEVSIANINVPESDAELQRAVDQHEQKCPICAGKGELMISLSGLEVCHTCKGTGHF